MLFGNLFFGEKYLSPSNEIKVGVVSLFSLAIFLYILYALQGIRVSQEGYNIRIIFKSAAGLTEKSQVRVAGIKIGEVQKLYLNNHTNKVIIIARIKKGIKVKDNSLFVISTDSLLALEKYIEIVPQAGESKFLKNNSQVEGEDPVEARELLTGFQNSLNQVQGISKSLQKVLGDDSLYSSVKETMANVSKASLHILKLTENIANITTNSQNDIYAIVKNFRNISDDLTVASEKLKTLAQDKGITEDLKTTLDNLKITSESAKKISQRLEKDVFTQENINEIKNTLKEGQKLVQNTNNIVEKINKTTINNSYNLEPTVDIGYKFHEKKVQTNANAEITKKNSPYFLKAGIEDLGEGNKANLQIGKKLKKNIKARIGFFSGKQGIGFDYTQKKLSLTAEVYDLNNRHNKLLGEYKIKKNLYFIFGWYDDLNTAGNGWVGVKVKK